MTDSDAKVPPSLPDERRKAIMEALNAKLKSIHCPMCGHEHFTLMSGYFANPLQHQLGGLTLGGPVVPAAVIACGNCGFLSQHALGALGMLPGKAVDK